MKPRKQILEEVNNTIFSISEKNQISAIQQTVLLLNTQLIIMLDIRDLLTKQHENSH